MFGNAEVVARGTWVYGGSVICNLRIVKSDILYGTGDYEDEPEISDDREVECYFIEYESITEKDVFDVRSEGFLALSDAMDSAEKSTNQKINWEL